jgi:hypothetical protein
LSSEIFSGDYTNQTTLVGKSITYFKNGEIIKLQRYDELGNSTEKIEFLYDGKNNPNKNMTGYQKIAIISGQKQNGSGVLQNLTTTTYNGSVKNFEYTYGSNGYPLTDKYTDTVPEFDSSGNSIFKEVVIETKLTY